MKETLNIAVLAPYKVYPAISGGERYIAFLYEYLSAVAPVTMLSVNENKSPGNATLHLKKLMGNSRLRYINPFLFFKIRRFIKENKVSHFFMVHPYFGWLGWLIKKTTPAKFVVQSHNIEGIRFKTLKKWWWPLLYNYEKWTHRGADLSFFVTNEDLEYAVRRYGLDKEKCFLVTYGTEIKTIPLKEERLQARTAIAAEQGLSNDEKVILFNGILDYRPNIDAVDTIVDRINPLLLAAKDLKYKIIICGKNLPASYNMLLDFKSKNIIYAGFVPDIKTYFLGADIFINPVNAGGGIKTKLVEALGYNLTAISTQTGANGVPPAVTGNKMLVFQDDDIAGLAKAIALADTKTDTPQAFFDHFYWPNIAERTVRILQQ